MRTRALIRLAVVLSVGGFATAALAATADDLKAAYAKAGKPVRWKLVRSELAHVETPEFRSEIVDFLKRFL